jgi:hypothetical protein
MDTIAKVGLSLNFLGTLMVCLSFGKNREGAYQTDDRNRRIYLASFLHPTIFRWGLILVAFGFLLQLVD